MSGVRPMHLDNPELATMLAGLIRKHGLRAFIETGTGYSVSLDWAHAQGLACSSCDVELRQVEAARARFPDVHIEHSESVPFLRQRCAEVHVPTLFWLDAHDADPFHGHGDAWPLLGELSVLAQLRSGHDCILVDDIADPRFDIESAVKPFRQTHFVLVRHGILWLEPNGERASSVLVSSV